MLVPAHDAVALCANSDPATNGGVACDYQYAAMVLANTEDEVIVEIDGALIDEVWYDQFQVGPTRLASR